MADLRLGRFRPIKAGIREVWKSQEMQDALRDLADEKAGEANSIAHLHSEHDEELYGFGVDVLRGTAMGYVETKGVLGRIEQRAHHTLDAINH